MNLFSTLLYNKLYFLVHFGIRKLCMILIHIHLLWQNYLTDINVKYIFVE